MATQGQISEFEWAIVSSGQYRHVSHLDSSVPASTTRTTSQSLKFLPSTYPLLIFYCTQLATVYAQVSFFLVTLFPSFSTSTSSSPREREHKISPHQHCLLEDQTLQRCHLSQLFNRTIQSNPCSVSRPLLNWLLSIRGAG